MSAEIRDALLMTNVPGLSLDVVSTEWFHAKMTDPVTFFDQSLATGGYCAWNATYNHNNFVSHLWNYYGPSSTRISSLSPPTIPDYNFLVGEAVSITLLRFCWGSS